MQPTAKKVALLLASLLVVATSALAQQPAMGVKVSENGRYFVDQNGKPLFWLGTTQWPLFQGYTLDEAKTILEKTKSHGFTFVQVKLLGQDDGTKPNTYGEKPLINEDPLTPNEAYFKNVDTVLDMARQNNLFVLVSIYHQKYRKQITVEKVRRWAKWLAERYKNQPNVVWSMTPEAKQEHVPIIRELAAGLHEGDGGGHLVSFKPDPSPYSSSFLHDERWLDFDAMQVWNGIRLIYPMLNYDYNLKPAKPVLMAEGVYEGSSSYGFEATPLWIRRQAYYSYLAGGHHAYGHGDSGRALPNWKQSLDSPGAVQMGVLKKIFMARNEWWLLTPDQSLFASGGKVSEEALAQVYSTDKERLDYVRKVKVFPLGELPDDAVLHVAARHRDGKWAMLYLADKATFSVDMSKISTPWVTLFWVNPITGEARGAGQQPNTGVKSFTTPNGWQDSLLVLTAADATADKVEPTASNKGPIAGTAPAAPAKGPLRVHPTNHRYFTDGSGKAILLVGSHTWANFHNNSYSNAPSPPTLDFDAHLAFLQRHNHNFFRLWTWQNTINPNVKQGTVYYDDPMPYLRPGPELALDGKPKFDLTKFNQAYFDRMRAFVIAARDKGIYASVMLFNGFSIEGKGNVGGDAWQGHFLNPKNNVNGIDGGGGKKVHTLENPAITANQEAYVRKIIDTVNDLDNVLYEITNEDTGGSANTEWQYHMIRFIKSCEAAKPKQHPVGMTVQYPKGSDAVLHQSPADWISPVAKVPAADGGKVVINDTDHSYFWIDLKADGVAAQRAWVWKNFTRGYQCIFMDPYLDPGKDPGRNNPSGSTPDLYWDPLRDAMGLTLRCATRMNLAEMTPHGDLVSSDFCLANPGKEYLVYLPNGGEVTVDLSAATGELAVEWMQPVEGSTTPSGTVGGGDKRTLKAPFDGDAVLYLRKK